MSREPHFFLDTLGKKIPCGLYSQSQMPPKPDYVFVSGLRRPVLFLVGMSLLTTLVAELWQWWYGDGDDGRPVLIKYYAATLILVMSPFYLYYSHKGCCQLTAGKTWVWTALRLWWNAVTGGYYGAWYYRTDTDRKNVLVADYGHDNWDDVVRQLGKEGLGPDGPPPPPPPPRLTPTARSSRPLAWYYRPGTEYPYLRHYRHPEAVEAEGG
jgi:hypothetical protein